MSILFIGSSNASAREVTPYAPDDAAFDYTDCFAVDADAARARFSRPLSDGQGFEYASPGSRVRFRTSADYIQVRLRYTNLITRLDTYNGVGIVLVDGVEVRSFNRAQGGAGPVTFTLNFASEVERDIEVVWPYCASVDLLGIDIPPGATMLAPTARTPSIYAAFGDSITHGFRAASTKSWAYRLAVLKGWQILNHGYGGRQCTPADGVTLGGLGADVATYMIGYNNFAAQTPIAVFKSSFQSFIEQMRILDSSLPLYCITPLWSPNTGAITLEQYRQGIRDTLSALGDANCTLVEGEPLATNSLAAFPDGVHPNDTASVQIALALSSTLSA